MKKYLKYLLSLALAAALMIPVASAAYADVPAEDALAPEVEKATEYGLMNGYGNGVFGFRDSMTRAQFVTVLSRMMKWKETQDHTTAAMALPENLLGDYRTAINAAAAHDTVDTDTAFRPDDAITRGEMAEMLVRAIGLKGAAAAADKENRLPFEDVTQRLGYITVAYEIGMTKGTSAATFAPDATATRAQAAAMLLRIYEKQSREVEWAHAYYAISSYSQLSLGTAADAVTLGWSRMTWDGSEALLATTTNKSYEYYIPSGYQEVVTTLEDNGVKLHLGVFMDLSNGITDLLSSSQGREEAAEQIMTELTVSYKALGRNPYSGVTIDFEGLRAADKENFTSFLQALSTRLKPEEKTLYVCVSPVLKTGAYYDGYDYRAIGEMADKVILMAYDYDARSLEGFAGTEFYKTAAPAPIDQIYDALRAITNDETGITDESKVVLGYSCKNVAWEIDENGKLLTETPVYPNNATVCQRLTQADTIHGWSDTYGMPYAVYTVDGKQYFLWYEDARSIALKADTAKLFGMDGVSFWRLGTIPDYEGWCWTEFLK